MKLFKSSWNNIVIDIIDDLGSQVSSREMESTLSISMLHAAIYDVTWR